MEAGELQPQSEKEPGVRGIGILLTAGSQEKIKGGHRIEPNLEGKIRALGALDDLAHGQIDRLFVVGGAKAHGRSLSNHYKNFLRRFVGRYNLDEKVIEDLPGGVETGSDLKRAVKELREREIDHNLRIYSTSFHLKRAKDIMRSLGYEVETVKAEDLTKARSRRHPQVVDSVITPEFLEKMRKREKRIMRVLSLDSLPVVGRLHPGLKLAELEARRHRRT